MIPVINLIKLHRSKWWSIDVLVAWSQLFVDNVTLQFTTDSRTVWQQNGKPNRPTSCESEEVKLFISCNWSRSLASFTHLKIVLVFLVKPSCTVNTLHHRVVAISTPVSTCYMEGGRFGYSLLMEREGYNKVHVFTLTVDQSNHLRLLSVLRSIPTWGSFLKNFVLRL